MTEVLDGIGKIAEKMGLDELNYTPSVVLINVPPRLERMSIEVAYSFDGPCLNGC